MDSLIQMRSVVEVAEQLSFVAAGRRLGISPFSDEWEGAAKTVLVCNNMEAALAATIGALGICQLPDFLAREAVDRRLLEPLLENLRPPLGQFSILWPSSRQLSPRLRAFIDVIADDLNLFGSN